ARLTLTTVDGAADRHLAIVVQHQVGMSAGTAQPALNAVVRLCNCCTDSTLRDCAIGIGGRTCNIAFPLQALAQFVIALAHMLAQNMSACGLVLAEVADGTIRGIALRLKISRTSGGRRA